jgi:hypothetical protein
MASSPYSTSTTVNILGGNPASIGNTTTPSIGNTGQVGFFGNATTTQPTTSNEAATISTAAVSVSATQWAFGTSTQANQIVTLVNQLRADLVALGLIKGS